MDLQCWHVIYTKPHREDLVKSQLDERGIESYYPYLRVERGYGRGIRFEPFFPNYLFFRTDLTSVTAKGLQWLPGVRRMVYVGDRPASVPNAIVCTLRKRLDPYRERTLQRSELLFQPGERVVLTSGPFEGVEGIFQKGLNGRDRVEILLDLVGTWTRAEVGAMKIKPLGQTQEPRLRARA